MGNTKDILTRNKMRSLMRRSTLTITLNIGECVCTDYQWL